MCLFLEFRLAAIQLFSGSNKIENVKHAVESIAIAAKNGANVVILPVR